MKRKKTSKIITCIFLSVIMLFSAISTGAAEYAPYDPVFKGRVTAAESEIDLSGIEIEVYSAEKVVSKFDDGSDFIYYGMTYDHSVYTDENGAFSFRKPSECFSYSIKLSTFPKGYGVDSVSRFCYPEDGMKEGTINISPISKVEAEYTGSGDGVIPRMFDGRGNAVMAEYTVTKDEIKTIDYETLVSLDELILTGTITASGVDFAYRVPVDISEMPVMSKIGAFFSLGAIDEGKKIEYYCYSLQDGRAKIDCGTSVLAEIQSYKNAHADEKLDSSLQNAIDSLIQAHNEALRSLNSSVSGSIGSFSYVVNYDSSITSLSVAQNVANEFESIYAYFVTNRGFTAPIPFGGTVYQINIISSGSLGNTTVASNGSSKIDLLYYVADNSQYNLKTVLAHEFFHAVTAAYDYNLYFNYPNNDWFTEGFSDLAGLVYNGASDNLINSHMAAYFNLPNKNIFRTSSSAVTAYGTMFFPYYIYSNLGGWNAIKSILNQLPITPISHSSVLQAITNSPYISNAGYAFLAAATRTYKPTHYYPLATSAWGTPASTTFAYSSYDLEGMAYRFHKYAIGSNITNFSCNFNISGNDPSGMELNVMKTNDSNYYSIATLTTGYSPIHVTLNNLSNTTAIVFCAVNTNAYENLNNYMTYSFSVYP